MTHADSHEPVDVLLAEYLEARRAGKRAESDALLRAHPELADEISAFIDDYEQLDRRFAPLRSLVDSTPCSAAEMPTFVSGDTAVAQPLQVGSSFGDYDLLAEIARGGMGVVYKVRQRSLNRVVALKMVLGGSRNQATDRDRFLVEARAVARLNHPHIVPIYEVGEHAGQPYFTMEFFAGGGLSQRIEELRGDQRAIAQLMITVARAVEHAHRRGILHRDLKPSNVLLDERRQPHVTDFGLAKRLDEGLAQKGSGVFCAEHPSGRSGKRLPTPFVPNPIADPLTQAGAIVGTPSYMAPEQAKSQTDLTTAVDVYGLGAVLYELLTGRPPFKAGTPLETLQKLVSQEPQPPRKLAATVDPDLETICLKCLEKDPLARYGSADALADDLERWLTGNPIQARPATATERVVKWARRQPLLAGLLGTIAAAVIALLALGGFLWQNAELRAQAVQDLGQAQVQLAQVDTERKQAEKERGQAEQEREQAKQLAAEQRKLADEQSKLADKQKDLADKFGAKVVQLQKTAEAEAAKADAARKQADAAQQQAAAALQQLAAARVEARRTLYAADVQLAHIAWQSGNVGSTNDLLDRYRPGSRSRETSVGAEQTEVSRLQLQEDVRGFEWHYLWRQAHAARRSWRPETATSASFAPVVGLAISPDGTTIATAMSFGEERRVRLWNVADGKLVRTIPLGDTNVTNLAFTDEGRRVLVTHRKPPNYGLLDKVMRELAAKKEAFSLKQLGDAYEFRSWSVADDAPARVEPLDAKRLDGMIFASLTGVPFFAHEGRPFAPTSLTRSPDGKYLAMAGIDVAMPGTQGPVRGGSVLVFDLGKSQVVGRRDGAEMVTSVSFAPESKLLAVGYSNGSIDLLTPDLGQQVRRITGHSAYVYCLQFMRATAA